MVWFLYNIIFAVGYTLMLPKFFLRMAKRGGYSDGFMQRFGCYDSETLSKLEGEGKIWVHAVSVGEVFVALKFMDEIRGRNDEQSFVLTVTTSTGHDIAIKNMDKRDVLLYFPVDFPVVARKVLNLIRPKALVLTECELWPNLIRLARDRDIPVAIINGRVSDSSYKGYQTLSFFAKRVINRINLLLVQTEMDASRLMSLGAKKENIHVLGSAKYDVVSCDEDGAGKAWGLLNTCGIGNDDLVLLGGSTWPGEEKALLKVFSELKKNYSSLKLVLVPRHAERRDEVESEIQKFDVSYRKRSEMADGESKPVDVLLVDTTGELKSLYACASVIFVGKSLTEHGGQNFIEPACYGKPIVTGPNLENFPVVAQDFIDGDGIVKVADEAALCRELKSLLSDPALRKTRGDNAKAVVDTKKGTVARSVDLIFSCLG
jgi:3-deoxy-D-manno-octulosonic-acid transferase